MFFCSQLNTAKFGAFQRRAVGLPGITAHTKKTADYASEEEEAVFVLGVAVVVVSCSGGQSKVCGR